MARKTKQQAQETRQQILDAAIREFSVRGVAATSLNDIANAAGVTRGAIYWHFKNKTDIFHAVWAFMESRISELELEYQTKFPDDPLRILRELLIFILVATVVDPQRRAMMEILYHKCEFVGEMRALGERRKVMYLESYTRIERVLQHCIFLEQLPANLDTLRSAIALRSYMTGIMESWLFTPDRFDLQQQAIPLVDNVIAMLRHSPFLRRDAVCAPNDTSVWESAFPATRNSVDKDE
ncbi:MULTISPECIES: multidrug efflux transporter transcriptional repressor AcrR [Edwardsiella]|uniref:Transcription repressor of multidrug efflux pump acrAB operon, TetR (AcrR) family n=2 Tax=Edwardsiella anguillarum TaxID=1821960 RepID=A0A076LLM2_9GAMM|nr:MULTISPECIES: multidrug efflux transporter transcriptional repressor AcrR [Edwardsiella]AIJ09385.1 Transcription repressor of multidrug efflux pump acrAB operon, TetR (AcrR) family [Edwardsiella anguillarum ET080813]AKR77208.1 multidrug efflux transporter transcriptional repressor AcrR [Edwardsiella sp. LADL05-105]KAB0590428.1 multidrug efflux transporter transcriptional repressor AcrR [Edwardsiella anguillarum]UOU80086.1 multidrug efflux transporter transcriptional repressor AcrR [Edwardsie